MPELTALLMLKNEQIWIPSILKAVLAAPFTEVLVFDCGSQDMTPGILRNFRDSRLKVWLLDPMSPRQNGAVRNGIMRECKTEWAFMVDGDELYPPGMLDGIINYPIPEGIKTGYILHQEINLKDGQLRIVSRKSAHRLHHRSTIWTGAFPFDVASTHGQPDISMYYPDELYGYHLHALRRSTYDKQVFLRPQFRRLRNEHLDVPIPEKDLPIFVEGLARADKYLRRQRGRLYPERKIRVRHDPHKVARPIGDSH